MKECNIKTHSCNCILFDSKSVKQILYLLLFIEIYDFISYELNQIGIKIDMYRQEYRFTPAFAFIQAV